MAVDNLETLSIVYFAVFFRSGVIVVLGVAAMEKKKKSGFSPEIICDNRSMSL